VRVALGGEGAQPVPAGMATMKELEALAKEVARLWGGRPETVRVRVLQETLEEAVDTGSGPSLEPVRRWSARASVDGGPMRRGRGDTRQEAMDDLAAELRSVVEKLGGGEPGQAEADEP